MKAFTRFLYVLSWSALCLACGGGGGGSRAVQNPPAPATAVTDESPGGIWTGTDADGGLVVVLVTESGSFQFVDEFLNQGSGTLSVINENEVSGNFQLATEFGSTFPDGTSIADCTLSGTVTERQTLTLTVNCTTTAGLQDEITVTLDYDPLYERDSLLATISGTYDDGSGIVIDIALDGTIVAQDRATGCVTNGQVSVIDSTFNTYEFQFGSSNCVGQSAASFEGLGDLPDGDFSSEAFDLSAVVLMAKL